MAAERLAEYTLSELMSEVGRRLACSEKKPQNIVLVGESLGHPWGMGGWLGKEAGVSERGGARCATHGAAPTKKPPAPIHRTHTITPPTTQQHSGPPGCGKGTQSPAIKRDYCLCHLATGERATLGGCVCLHVASSIVLIACDSHKKNTLLC